MNASRSRLTARQRITRVVEAWFLTEPLLFAAWTMHDVAERTDIATIRVARGAIEFNPGFVDSLNRDQLRAVLAFEAMRILLGHPYSRRQPEADLSYQASNLTVQECLRTELPIPRAREVFDDERFDDQYFEFYYRELAERAADSREDREPPDQRDVAPDPSSDEGLGPDADGDDSPEQRTPDQDDSEAEDEDHGRTVKDGHDDQAARSDQSLPGSLDAYRDPGRVGAENTGDWGEDDLRRDEINQVVREAAATNGWGTIGGTAKEQLLATLDPKLDFRGVLRNFRQSVLAVRRSLTRMKPSRRYGFAQMGSRYDFSTKLLFAVDVSGSMGSRDLQLGFSVVSRFFRYGIESVDVVWFDQAIRCDPITLRRARRAYQVTGRGGTDFQPVIDYIDRNRQYDGLIIFTDGYAPVPSPPSNRRTRVLWLFKDEATYRQMKTPLGAIGRSVFLKESPR